MLYNYQCSEHGVFEQNRSIDNRKFAALCPECWKEAPYIVAAPQIKLPGWDTSWPTAAAKWERMHEVEGRKKPEQ